MTWMSDAIPLNSRAGWMGWWPGWRSVLDPENGRINLFLQEEIALLEDGAWVLDASAGARPYASLFQRQHYQSCDVPGGFYECKHDFECYLDSIPKPSSSHDAVVLTQVLEHVQNPFSVLREIARITRPGGVLLVSVPLNGPLHGEPWHFFQYTQYGLKYLADQTGWRMLRVEKIGGAFWFLGKRLGYLPRDLMKSIDPFRAKRRGRSPILCAILTLMLSPLWVVAVLIFSHFLRPVSYWLDRLDVDKRLTTGFTCVFERID